MNRTLRERVRLPLDGFLPVKSLYTLIFFMLVTLAEVVSQLVPNPETRFCADSFVFGKLCPMFLVWFFHGFWSLFLGRTNICPYIIIKCNFYF